MASAKLGTKHPSGALEHLDRIAPPDVIAEERRSLGDGNFSLCRDVFDDHGQPTFRGDLGMPDAGIAGDSPSSFSASLLRHIHRLEQPVVDLAERTASSDIPQSRGLILDELSAARTELAAHLREDVHSVDPTEGRGDLQANQSLFSA